MRITAQVQNSRNNHQVNLRTGNSVQSLQIPPKSSGLGSSASGGELLFLALATCYCNDIYREAAKRKIEVSSVEVEVSGDFNAEGAPAQNVSYRAKVTARAGDAEIRELMQHTDHIAEIQNTLRVETPVTLNQIETVSI